MKWLQKLGKALMLPVACLPICGILMGIGYLLCPATMQGGEITGIIPTIGLFLVKAGGALIDNMAILFAIGVGVGMSDDHDGTAGLAALASWLMVTAFWDSEDLASLAMLAASSFMLPDALALRPAPLFMSRVLPLSRVSVPLTLIVRLPSTLSV